MSGRVLNFPPRPENVPSADVPEPVRARPFLWLQLAGTAIFEQLLNERLTPATRDELRARFEGGDCELVIVLTAGFRSGAVHSAVRVIEQQRGKPPSLLWEVIPTAESEP